MPPNLDPRRLESFRVVATSGSVSAAARLLHLSQPALTAQIRQLEEECGRPLFERTPQGMLLNAAGKTLLRYAQRLHSLLEEASGALVQDEALEGELVLAASTTIASYVLPQLLSAFVRAHPRIGVRMDVGNTAEVLAWVKAGQAPLGLVEGHARAAGIRLQRFLDDELVVVVAGDAPRHLIVADVAGFDHVPTIWREPGSGTRAVVERGLRTAGSRRRSRSGDLQLASTEAIKAAAAHGAGIAFLSHWSIASELALGRLRVLPVRGLHLPRTFSWALPAEAPAGVAGRFLRFARETPPTLGG